MLVLIFTNTGHAFEVERFERMYTRHGLSQNNVQSIYCDHDGFLWAGTMNGLNRFDGYNFKVYKSDPNIVNTLTQNRVIKIFEDERKLLWLETNDRFYHYFIRATEEFISFPRYSKTVQESNSIISAFHQYDRDHIWLGSTRTGLYLLRYDEASNRYGYRQFISPSQDHGPFTQ
jgi:ligand-binding sensor domain-containing protein